ncbi:MAG: aminotransferase class V-fold PLP-dependent enzyme [Cyclobacteriaceae bacterium]
MMKEEFPIFETPPPNGKPLIFLDSAATTQKPKSVMDAVTQFYSTEYANSGRGLYWPSKAASNRIDDVRSAVAEFIGAETDEIVFTGGTTDAINKLARSYVLPLCTSTSNIVLTGLEHHANLIPWQQVANLTGAELRVVELDDSGEPDFELARQLIDNETVLVAATVISNVLGHHTNVQRMIELAHQKNTPVLLDAAQSIGHSLTDVRVLDCEFLVFSSHKMYGPSGVGVLYGKKHLLETMQPLSFGGGIVLEVDAQTASFKNSPDKHEAGTLNVEGIVGLGAAIDWINSNGIVVMGKHEADLRAYAIDKLFSIPGFRLLGRPDSSLFSFVLEHLHPHDLATFLANESIAVRSGNHCAQPLINHLGVGATTRVSFGVYNLKDDVDALVDHVKAAQLFFHG